jgi:large subunit ribosomal protein L1
MKKVNKRLREAVKAVDREKALSLADAVVKVEQFPKVKFDETVELHLALNLDLKANDQAVVRGTVVLPNGLGKDVKVAVVCKGELEQKAKEAGAEFVGAQDLIDKIAGGFMDFDVLVAAPDMMRDLSKLGKILGPKGLMPTPKAGTVAADVAKAVRELKAGKVEFKSDKQAGIHIGIGKRSFPKEKLVENAQHLLDAVNHAKPNSVKGAFYKSAFISTTMGPGVRIVV